MRGAPRLRRHDGAHVACVHDREEGLGERRPPAPTRPPTRARRPLTRSTTTSHRAGLTTTTTDEHALPSGGAPVFHGASWDGSAGLQGGGDAALANGSHSARRGESSNRSASAPAPLPFLDASEEDAEVELSHVRNGVSARLVLAGGGGAGEGRAGCAGPQLARGLTCVVLLLLRRARARTRVLCFAALKLSALRDLTVFPPQLCRFSTHTVDGYRLWRPLVPAGPTWSCPRLLASRTARAPSRAAPLP